MLQISLRLSLKNDREFLQLRMEQLSAVFRGSPLLVGCELTFLKMLTA